VTGAAGRVDNAAQHRNDRFARVAVEVRLQGRVEAVDPLSDRTLRLSQAVEQFVHLALDPRDLAQTDRVHFFRRFRRTRVERKLLRVESGSVGQTRRACVVVRFRQLLFEKRAYALERRDDAVGYETARACDHRFTAFRVYIAERADAPLERGHEDMLPGRSARQIHQLRERAFEDEARRQNARGRCFLRFGDSGIEAAGDEVQAREIVLRILASAQWMQRGQKGHERDV